MEEEYYVGKTVMVLEVPRKRTRGRPKRSWLDNIRNDLSKRELSGQEAKTGLNGGDSYKPLTPQKSRKGCGSRRLKFQICHKTY